MGTDFPPGKSLEPEEIKRLVVEGWNFRIKESHGKRYITRRKRGEERSIGPFNEDLWNLITEQKGKTRAKAVSSLIEHEVQTTASNSESPMKLLSDRLESMESEVKQLRSLVDQVNVKTAKCCHIISHHGKKYCKAWSWGTKPNNLGKILPNISIRKENIYGSLKWYASPHLEICGTCTKFMENWPIRNDETFGLHQLLIAASKKHLLIE